VGARGFNGASGYGKFGMEMPVKLVLAPPAAAQRLANPTLEIPEEVPPLDAKEDLANWKALAMDTRVNETARRQQIHQLLAKSGPVSPADVTKKVYKQVLHVDLDDAYLGLGEVLFASYPFAEEDGGR
jgi:hypothetical protein